MNKTIKELTEGKEYIFIEANPNKSKDLNIVKATLREKGKCERGYFPVFVEKETQGEIFVMLNNEQANKPLNNILVVNVNSNYDKPQVNEKLEALFGTFMNPIGYIICENENVQETIEQYSNFLTYSIKKYEERIKEMTKDMNNKKILYKQQITWLKQINW